MKKIFNDGFKEIRSKKDWNEIRNKLEHLNWVRIRKVILKIYGNFVKPTKYS